LHGHRHASLAQPVADSDLHRNRIAGRDVGWDADVDLHGARDEVRRGTGSKNNQTAGILAGLPLPALRHGGDVPRAGIAPPRAGYNSAASFRITLAG
jgi:hypothetical protein